MGKNAPCWYGLLIIAPDTISFTDIWFQMTPVEHIKQQVLNIFTVIVCIVVQCSYK
jgi:hypothetical protein